MFKSNFTTNPSIPPKPPFSLSLVISGDTMRRFTGYICRSAVRYLDVSVSRAMLCFFACFRTKDSSDSSYRSNSSDEASMDKDQMSTLFPAEEKEEFDCNDAQCSPCVCPEINNEVRDEAKFLKACGTLLETPIEIRKASKKLNGSPPADEDSASSEFHSWLPNSSINALQLDTKIDQSPTSVNIFDEHTPISCLSKTRNSRRILNGGDDAETEAPIIGVHPNKADNFTTPFTPWPSAINIQSRNKSVRFECDFETSAFKGLSPENGYCENSKKLESPWQPSVSKPTPKPTPLKLTDEMQTPGTVFPNNAESCANGKARIRSQYVYSVSNPAELCLSVAENGDK